MTRKQRKERDEWERRARQRAAEAAYPDSGGYIASLAQELVLS